MWDTRPREITREIKASRAALRAKWEEVLIGAIGLGTIAAVLAVTAYGLAAGWGLV